MLEGNAYELDAERFPHSLREAIAALEEGSIAHDALGDEVVDHYSTTPAPSSASSMRWLPAMSASG